MSSKIEIAGIEISELDWNATPESIKAVVIVLSERLAYIEEQLQQNSQNSSRPPSSDGFVKPEKAKLEKQKKPQKKQSKSNSARKTRKLYPLEACKEGKRPRALHDDRSLNAHRGIR